MIKVEMLAGNPQGLKAGTVVKVGIAPAKEMQKKEWAKVIDGEDLLKEPNKVKSKA